MRRFSDRPRLHAIAFAFAEQDSVRARDAKLEALGNPMRPFDEPLGGLWRTNIARRLLEQGEPAVEMARIYRQGQVLRHRLAVVAPGHERQRRPEREHLFEIG